MTKTRAVEFKEAVLPNGLSVIAEVNPEARSVALGYFCKTGSRDETPEMAGVSHFLEHMLFKGSERRGALEVNLEFDRMGAQYNAFTSEENTVYYGAVLPEFALELLELWTDLMRPALRLEDFETEKQVILEEIALYEDRPQVMLFDRGRARYFRGHPLGNSVLGTRQSIGGLVREQMVAYHAQRYVPSNLVLALAGRVDWERVLERVEALTAAWPQGKLPGATQSPRRPPASCGSPTLRPPRPTSRFLHRGFLPRTRGATRPRCWPASWGRRATAAFTGPLPTRAWWNRWGPGWTRPTGPGCSMSTRRLPHRTRSGCGTSCALSWSALSGRGLGRRSSSGPKTSWPRPWPLLGRPRCGG